MQAHDRAFAEALGGLKPTKVIEGYSDALVTRNDLLGLVADYRELKRQHGLVEFADQMAQAARLVASSREVPREVRARHSVVLLDEYQDTSSAQAQLLRGLFSGETPEDGRGHPVTAVGDPFQAIYGWRGAAPSNILQFGQDFPLADGNSAHRYRLTVNRRSRQLILDAANQLAAPLRSDIRLQLPEASDGEEQLLRAPEDRTGGLLRVASFDTWPDEVEWVADQVVLTHDERPERGWSQIAVLTRTNASIGPIYDALTSRDVPVEIVGLGGLLEIPEIADIVATLQLLDDVTANPDLVQLLSGARWRIGPRDLAVLGDRARRLARASGASGGGGDQPLLGASLDPSAAGCLMDAVADPGDAPLSSQARERLAAFTNQMRELARHRDEPVLDLVHRVIDSSGVGLELDADPEWYAAGRGRQLTQFVDAVADYIDIDGDGALSGLLAWLAAERDQAQGLDQAVPSSADSVKLLTVHRAKGLEWDVVLLPGLCAKTFPTGQPTPNWLGRPETLPSGLRGDSDWVPQVGDLTAKKWDEAYKLELGQAQRQAEDRLAYVALTRARETLIASHHHWFPGRVGARDPSPYFLTLLELARQYGQVEVLADASDANPLGSAGVRFDWPDCPDQMRLVRLAEAAEMIAAHRLAPGTPGQSLDTREQANRWHQAAQGLVDEARQRRRRGDSAVLPASISASALMLAHRDPGDFAAQLLRPMPRPVGREASVGTRFHEWLQTRFALTALFDPEDELADVDGADASTADLVLRRLTAAFERGRYADRVPLCVEEPFILVLGDQQIRGRIDAVFATPEDPDHDYQVVDWKTSNRPADPLQLALYRLAWARSVGVPTQRVDAVFHHVLNDEVERPELLDEEALAGVLSALGQVSPPVNTA